MCIDEDNALGQKPSLTLVIRHTYLLWGSFTKIGMAR
ncbi:unnamed protein product [Tenebrio molitor]|nr:unnamed protein product [Tenebrio molitor]